VIDCSQYERDLLGHCLSDEIALQYALSDLVASDFTLSSHREIFAAIAKLDRDGCAVNGTSVAENLRIAGRLEGIGGYAYLYSLTEYLMRNSKAVRDYAKHILAATGLKQLAGFGEATLNQAMLNGADFQQLLEETQSRLDEIRASRTQQQDITLRQAIPALLERMQIERHRSSALLGLSSGISSMDTMTRGYQPGELTLIGSRSGVGKSCLMTQTALSNCTTGIPVAVYSLEMSRQQILRRIIAAHARVPFPRVADPKWATEVEMAAMNTAAHQIAEWPLLIVDESALFIEKLTALARLAIRREGVKLICVDYVQIVSATGRDERLRVAAVSRGLTRLAKDEGVPVMALSQLARPDRSSINRRPAMSDLRESSQLENDAHTIVLLHREWDDDEGRLSSNAELIVAKQRSGETGAVPLRFNRRSLTFEPQQAADAQRRAS
jgi:replicative DNA helicase